MPRSAARLIGSRTGRWRRMALGGCACALWLAGSAEATQRELRTRVANHDHAPVLLAAASMKLLQTYGDPNQAAAVALAGGRASTRTSRVRYMNRMNQEIPLYQLEGELSLRNTTSKGIEMLQLTTVFLNAFRERISVEQQAVAAQLLPYRSQPVRWSRSVPNPDVFELYLAVTKVRFSDGTIWAPSEELILLP